MEISLFLLEIDIVGSRGLDNYTEIHYEEKGIGS